MSATIHRLDNRNEHPMMTNGLLPFGVVADGLMVTGAVLTVLFR